MRRRTLLHLAVEAQKIALWMDMPVWVPPGGDDGGMTSMSRARALAKGLVFRPIVDTARDTLAWWKTLPAERRAKLRAGLTPERERAALAALQTPPASPAPSPAPSTTKAPAAAAK